ncbi:hypothetical protein A9X05_11290 [Mycobacterium sp. E3298]|nr:hypothetical protein A9X05_11290 [Mycobacterium sp. E3298]
MRPPLLAHRRDHPAPTQPRLPTRHHHIQRATRFLTLRQFFDLGGDRRQSAAQWLDITNTFGPVNRIDQAAPQFTEQFQAAFGTCRLGQRRHTLSHIKYLPTR